MKQRYWQLLIPSMMFMAFCMFLALGVAAFSSMQKAGQEAPTELAVLLAAGFVLLPAVWIWVRCAVMLTATAYLRGEDPDSGQMNAVALRRFPTAVGASLTAATMTSILYGFFILPGVYASIRKWFILPAVLFENANAFNADNRSADATRGKFWEILLGGFLGSVAGMVAFGIAALWAIQISSQPEMTAGNLVKLIVLFLAWPVIGTFTSVQRVVQYWKYTTDLKTVSLRKRGPSPLTVGAEAREAGPAVA